MEFLLAPTQEDEGSKALLTLKITLLEMIVSFSAQKDVANKTGGIRTCLGNVLASIYNKLSKVSRAFQLFKKDEYIQK